MEEGPEPQELLESLEDRLHERDEKRRKDMRSAMVAATLAVLAALGSLMSGHSANEAIILRSQASDQWSYYQAKSTKAHLYEVERDLVQTMAQLIGSGGTRGAAAIASSASASTISAKSDSQLKTYNLEKAEIERKAKDLEQESTHALAAHQVYSFAVACFQIGIVLVSVSMLIESAGLFGLSLSSGLLGIVLLLVGLVR